MNIKEFNRLKSFIDRLVSQLEEEAIEAGMDITSKKFDGLVIKLKTKLLKEKNMSYEDYTTMESEFEADREIEDSEILFIPGMSKKIRERHEATEKEFEALVTKTINEFVEELNNTRGDLEDTIKDTKNSIERLIELTSEKDRKNVTNKLKAEIQQEIDALEKRIPIGEIAQDLVQLQSDLVGAVESIQLMQNVLLTKDRKPKKEFSDKEKQKLSELISRDWFEYVQKSINDITPRLWRGLGMGLQQQIDDLRSEMGTGSEDVVGPSSATNEDIAVFDGTTGKLIKDGGKTIAQTLARANHTGTQAASTINDFDTEVSNNVSVTANTAKITSKWEVDGTETQLITADEIDMQSKKIINLLDPTDNQDAATKKYVDDTIIPDTDAKVGVDSSATAGYLGAASGDGVLRSDATLDYTDGGDFVTLGLDSTLKSNYDAGYSHISADGSSHTFIDQDVTSGSSPTLDGTNFSGIPYGALTTCSKIIIIDPTGCADYTTIQAALDDNTAGGELFIVNPGTYTNDTINFTANNQAVSNAGRPNTTVVTNSAQIVEAGDFTNCSITNLNIQFNPNTAVNGIEVNNGSLVILQSRLQLATSSTITGPTQPSLLATTGTGTLKTKLGEMYCLHTGNTTNGLKTILSVSDGGTIQILRPCKVSIVNSGTAAATTMFIDAGTGEVDIEQACSIEITDPNAAIVAGFGYIGGSGDQTVSHSTIKVTGGGSNDCYAVYLGGTGTFRSSHNNALVTGGANNYAVFIGASATLNGHFDDIRAADGNIVNGTINIVSSLSDGDALITGDLGDTAGRVTKIWATDIESTNTPTIGGTALSAIYPSIYGDTNITKLGTISAGTWNVTGFDAANIGDGSVTNAEFQSLSAVTSTIQGQLDALDFGTTNITKLGTISAGTWSVTGQDVANWANGSVSNSEFQALSAVTSDIQAQLDAAGGASIYGETTFTKVGTISAGVWNGTAIDISDYTNLSATVPITLTDDAIGLDQSLIVNLPNLTEVGTISAGTWSVTGFDAANIGDGSVTNAEFQSLSAVTSTIQGQLDTLSFGTTNITKVGTISAGVWSGTNIDATSIGNGDVTNTELSYINSISANIQTQLAARGSIYGETSITKLGTISAGTWSVTGQDIANFGDGSVTNAEFQSLSAVTSTIQGQLDAKASDFGSTNITKLGTISAGTWAATDIAVNQGGTGRASALAYSVLLGGTTDTGAHQNVSAVGTAGQVLTSNGAGATPSFQDAGGGGTDIFDKFIDIIMPQGATLEDHWDIDKQSNSSISSNGIELYIGTYNNEYAYIRANRPYPVAIWATGGVHTVEWAIVSVGATTDQTSYMLFTADTSGEPSLTSRGFGFKIVNADIYATSSDGTEEATDTGTDVTTNSGDIIRLKAVYTQGTDVKFYVDGVLVATHTTRVPQGGTTYEWCVGQKSTAAQSNSLRVLRTLIDIQTN